VGKRILRAKGPKQGLQTTRVVVTRDLQLDHQRLSYSEGGVGAPIILLHGLGASSRWWFPLFPELTSAQLRIIAPDLPGFGRTPGPTLSIKDAARIVVELADHHKLGHFFLAGHSMGGAIAAQIAADYGGRVRRLILVDSAGIPHRLSGRWVGRVMRPWAWCPLGFYRTLLGDLIRSGPGNMRAGIREVRRYDIRPLLDRIEMPTLLIWGEKDSLIPVENGREIANGLTHGRLEVISKARHLPMVSDPSATSQLILKFLKEELATSSSG